MKPSLWILVLGLTRCSSTTLVELDASHPASPSAMEAPQQQRLRALALESPEPAETSRQTHEPAAPEASQPAMPPAAHGAHHHDH